MGNRVKDIFSETIDLTPAERGPYLDRVCAGDSQLRQEVERLLAASDDTGGILDETTAGELLSDLLVEADEPAHTLGPGDRVGRFQILHLLGRGGMGEVHEAEDLEFGGRVAVKTLRYDLLRRPDFARRFRREIRLARKVTHPNVCRILDVGTHPGPHGDVSYLTMELLEGETLAERLKRGPLGQLEAVPVFSQIALGLQALHDVQVVHRDLKPANVILVPSPNGRRCVITDFGLAQTADNPADSPAGAECLTVAGQLMGTPAYMPPEQLSGNSVGTFSDVYALGIVMYESLCGTRPFLGDQFVKSATEKLGGSPKPPSQIVPIDSRWDSLILRCLEVDEKRRPSTPELLRLLEELATPEELKKVATTLRRRSLVGPLSYLAVAATLAATGATIGLRKMPPSFLRSICEKYPGRQSFCSLPADKSIAVFPFLIKGATEADRSLATGTARYVREAFYRLAPDPDKMCVHLRGDHFADSVQLIMEGEVEAGPTAITLRGLIREAKPLPGHAAGLVLREFEVRVPRSNAADLHHQPLEEIASALSLTYAPATLRAWSAAGPKSSPSFLRYLEGLGNLEAQHYKQAAEVFSSAIDPAREFDFAPAHVGLGDAYRFLANQTKDHTWETRARQAYERGLSFDGPQGFASARKRLGEMELGLENYPAAIQHLTAALKIWPDDHLLMKSLERAYESSGQPEQAEKVLQAAVARAPKCWLTHNTLADFYARYARFAESEKAMLKIIRMSPDNATAYHNLALIYFRAGRFDDSTEMASKSIRIRPIAITYSTLGTALLFNGCQSDGMVNLQKAASLDPASFVMWGNLSEGYNMVSPGSKEAIISTSRALDLSTKTLETQPDFVFARAQRAIQLARLGENKAAAEEARKALQQAHGSHDIILKAAETLELAGYRSEALTVLDGSLAEGLSMYELIPVKGLEGLRRSAGFLAIVKRRKLDHLPDPGGLTPPARRACPASNSPGLGLKKI